MSRDHYRTLGLAADAGWEDIQRAYRLLARRYHPDRNPAADAAAKMLAVNEAYESLKNAARRNRRPSLRPAPQWTQPILQAARERLQFRDWTVVEDAAGSLLLECGRERIRILFVNRLDNGLLSRIARQYHGFAAVLAVSIEGQLLPGPRTAVFGLVRSERYGAPVPEGACKSLLAAFL